MTLMVSALLIRVFVTPKFPGQPINMLFTSWGFLFWVLYKVRGRVGGWAGGGGCTPKVAASLGACVTEQLCMRWAAADDPTHTRNPTAPTNSPAGHPASFRTTADNTTACLLARLSRACFLPPFPPSLTHPPTNKSLPTRLSGRT